MNIEQQDAFELAYVFLNRLKKGDEFTIRRRRFMVKSEGFHVCDWMKQPKQRTLTIISESNTIKMFHVSGYGWGGNPKSMSRSSERKQHDFIRNIEGELILDLLNSNNPFHEPSMIYKMARN